MTTRQIFSKQGAPKELKDRSLNGPIFPMGPESNQLAVHPHPVLRRDPSQSHRGLVSDEAIPFSWFQCALSLFAYAWLLSNFLRTGFAIRQLDSYNTIEPNVFVNFGPYAYPGNTFVNNGVGTSLTNVTAAKPVALWGYKYDTTSLAIRAFAEYLNVSTFPACVLYRGKCDSNFLAPATGFRMLDSLVDIVRDAGSIEATPSSLANQVPKYHELRPRTQLVRASYEFFDRIHHYIMPQMFTNPFWRTCQVLYYSSELLSQVSTIHQSANSSPSFVDFCSLAYGGLRPYFCDNLWTNFGRACSSANPKGRAVGHVSAHAVTRLSKLRALYPNATVDLLLVEGIKDIAIQLGGFTFLAKWGADVVTLFRIRICSNIGPVTSCETLVLDEYRYEGETFTTDILWYYSVVASLRGAAQVYYWLRLVMLFGGCYYAAATQANSEDPSSTWKTVKRALSIFFKIPSQVIIYGSAFPLTCYFFAHVIDSPMVYELMGQKFDSFNGLFQLSIAELITVSSIQMRNVWVLATIVHIFVRVSTHRRWTPLHGVWGMPQFSIALISSLTIFSQFRFISLRWTPIRKIQGVHVTSRLHPVVESLFHVSGSGGNKAALGGIFLDLKAMTCSAAVLALLAGLITVTTKVLFRKSSIKLIFWRSHSVTPLSAGVLWPTTCLAVCWNDDLFHIQDLGSAVLKRVPSTRTKIQPSKASLLLTSNLSILQHTVKPIKIESLDERSQVVESTLYLMNIAMLSDPLAFLLWKWNLSKISIEYYRSAKNQQRYLVPWILAQKRSELDWCDFELERTVLAHELTWREIITCG